MVLVARAAALVRRLRFRPALRAFLRRHATRASRRQPVLIWDLGNFPAIVARNGLFATALKLRGERTHTILCDGTPIACIQRGIEKPERLPEWPRRCAQCLRGARQAAEKYDLEYSLLGDYVDDDKRREFRRLAQSLAPAELLDHEYRGANIGRMAWSSLNRHMKGLLVEPGALSAEQEAILREYFYAGLVNVHAAATAIERMAPRSVLTSHGVYIDYAPAMSVAFQRGVPAMSWSSAYAAAHHYFTLPKGPNQLLLQGVSSAALWKERAGTPLTAEEESRLEQFLHHRYSQAGAHDIRVVSGPEERATLRARLGLREGRRVLCIFAHVNWDACFDMSSMIYPHANAWVLDSMRRAFENTEVDWVVRVHPGELTDGSVLSTGDIIKSAFPRIPPHVKVLWADSDVNSYGLYRMIDGGVTIFGTPGIELAAMGKPVILAGVAHYGGKGFTVDCNSQDAYRAALARAAEMAPLSAEQTALARRYAYWYFVQRHVPIRAIDRSQGHWGDLDVARLERLLPGRDPVMDTVCRSILEGSDVVLPSDAVREPL
jgi:hypothetical protein